MKKLVPIISCIILGLILFLLCFDYNKNNYPNELFNVYLDGKYLGVIKDKKELEDYINEQSSHLINVKNITKSYCETNNTLEQIKEQDDVKKLINNSKDIKYYKVNNKKCMDIILENGEEIDKIYAPNGINIEKILTYKNDIDSVEDIYKKMLNLKSFTVDGYQFTIKKEKPLHIYTLNKEIFEDSVNEFITTYVNENDYRTFIDGNQLKIDTVGSLLENVYIEENINVKPVKISMDNFIFTDSKDLANFLLYGKKSETKKYKVKEGETISDIAFKNEISNKEFLISNSKYKTENSLIKPGTEVLIQKTNPQLSVVIEKFIVEDKPNDYKTIYQYDSEKFMGYEKVAQEGEKGLERISQKQKIINGNIVYVKPINKEALKPSIDKIIIKGDKVIPNVGDLNNWAWPTESGWVITSEYAWRIHPLTGKRTFHNGLDISGTGYNSDIYAANNGTVIVKEYRYDYGNYMVINHNNGYFTVYAHMNKFVNSIKIGDTVSRGQKIGYMGSTGYSTGPHLHFEVWKNCKYCRISPWSLYR